MKRSIQSTNLKIQQNWMAGSYICNCRFGTRYNLLSQSKTWYTVEAHIVVQLRSTDGSSDGSSVSSSESYCYSRKVSYIDSLKQSQSKFQREEIFISIIRKIKKILSFSRIQIVDLVRTFSNVHITLYELQCFIDLLNGQLNLTLLHTDFVVYIPTELIQITIKFDLGN